MGRVSKRGTGKKAAGRNAETMEAAVGRSSKRYRAGIYARLSAGSGEQTGQAAIGTYQQQAAQAVQAPQTESIETQIEIGRKFIEDFNRQHTDAAIELVRCYTDMGKTGTNFERAGFLSLLQDIRLGEINCVIVKDLSRFGRNYLEAGNYIEKIFPFLGVRFIAVADGYDTGSAGNENRQMASEIKNLVNDMYAKDFSKKAKIQLKGRREEGSYVGGPPPYGYRTEWQGKRRVLVPDEKTAPIVRMIYETFAETEKYAAVADRLNRKRVNPPAIYRRTGEVYFTADETAYKGWDKGAVERILQSDTYAGTLTQGKTTLTARNEKNRIHKPKEDWVVIQDAHAPLIDRELYQKALETRERIAQKSASRKHPAKEYLQDDPIAKDIFDGMLYCGVCGKKMTRSTQVKTCANGEAIRQHGYFCANSGQTKVTVCPVTNRISQKELWNLLLPLIRVEFPMFFDKPAKRKILRSAEARMAGETREAETNLRELRRKQSRMREEESSAYMDYRSGSISQEEYAAAKRHREDALQELQKAEEERKKQVRMLEKQAEKYLAAVKVLMDFRFDKGMTGKDLIGEKITDKVVTEQNIERNGMTDNNMTSKDITGKDTTEEMLRTFVDKITIYPGKRVEVHFAFTADRLRR